MLSEVAKAKFIDRLREISVKKNESDREILSKIRQRILESIEYDEIEAKSGNKMCNQDDRKAEYIISSETPSMEVSELQENENNTRWPIKLQKNSQNPSMVDSEESSGKVQRQIKSRKGRFPKVVTMNNLIRLSDHLSPEQILKEIKFKAKELQISPKRLFLYFCIEERISGIARQIGIRKLQDQFIVFRDLKLIVKQIQKYIVDLIIKFPTIDRSLLSRITRAIFARVKIKKKFSQKWLSEIINFNDSYLESNGVNVRELLEMENKNISTKIFSEVPNILKSQKGMLQQIIFEDSAEEEEIIDDPQYYVQKSKLFYQFPFEYEDKLMKIRKQKSVRFIAQKSKEIKQMKIKKRIKLCIKSIRIIKRNRLIIEEVSQSLNEHNQDIEQNYSQKIEKKRERINKNKKVHMNQSIEKMSNEKNYKQKEEVKETRQEIEKKKIENIVNQFLNSNIDKISEQVAKRLFSLKNNQKEKEAQNDKEKGRAQQAKNSFEKNNKNEEINERVVLLERKSISLEHEGIYSEKGIVRQIFDMVEKLPFSKQMKKDIMKSWLRKRRERLKK